MFSQVPVCSGGVGIRGRVDICWGVGIPGVGILYPLDLYPTPPRPEMTSSGDHKRATGILLECYLVWHRIIVYPYTLLRNVLRWSKNWEFLQVDSHFGEATRKSFHTRLSNPMLYLVLSNHTEKGALKITLGITFLILPFIMQAKRTDMICSVQLDAPKALIFLILK